MQKIDFVISPELQAFIQPLKPEEFAQLKENIERDGEVRDPLIIWRKSETEKILIDGHNRHVVIQQIGLGKIPFKTQELEFADIDAVKDWMINKQLGQRNLTDQQKSYLRGVQYEREKKKVGNPEMLLGQNVPIGEGATRERLAEQHKVSSKTIQRDEKFAQIIDAVGKIDMGLKADILNKTINISKTDLEKVFDAGKIKEFVEHLQIYKDVRKALDAVFPLGERTRIQASMEFPPTAPEEEEEEYELTPEEKEIIEGIRAIHPALADQFEKGEIVCEHLNIHAKLFKHPEELQKVYFDAFFETQSIEQAYNIFHEHRQKAQEYPKEKEPEEEQKEPDTTPAQPLVIKSYPAQHDVFVVYGVNTLTGKNKLQNAVVDFVRQYINLAFNDFTAIYEGVEKELDRLNSLYKNCAPLKVGKRESEHGASIWITPKDSTVSFEASILCKKITKILEGASLAYGLSECDKLRDEVESWKDEWKKEFDRFIDEEEKNMKLQDEIEALQSQQAKPTQIRMASLEKLASDGWEVVKLEGNKILQFVVSGSEMYWNESSTHTSQAEAKKQIEKLLKNPKYIKLEF